MRKNTYSSTQTIVVDKTSGEISNIETVKKERIYIESEPFYMVFIDYISPLFNLKNGTSKAVLSLLCCRAEFNTGKVSISSADRKDICDKLDISNNVLSMSLKELNDKKLISGAKGTYIINAQIFWKGDLKTRNATIHSKSFQVAFSIDIESIEGLEKVDRQDIPDEFAIKD